LEVMSYWCLCRLVSPWANGYEGQPRDVPSRGDCRCWVVIARRTAASQVLNYRFILALVEICSDPASEAVVSLKKMSAMQATGV
jgi:hypothetical protein